MNKITKLLNILRVLIIMWLFETLFAALIYSISYFLFSNYYSIELYNVRFFTITNSSVFIFISIILSLIFDVWDLFIDYSFFCNLIAIAMTPFLLSRLDKLLPSNLNIFK